MSFSNICKIVTSFTLLYDQHQIVIYLFTYHKFYDWVKIWRCVFGIDRQYQAVCKSKIIQTKISELEFNKNWETNLKNAC